ncbi:hypothetical protein, partial [Methylobacterium trifolii]|uniref:hypothetical protein n=1 Tax=Methylobacterium trifolii TaxID=1003092 RepID=UPI001EDDB611
MPDNQTTGELYKAQAINEADVVELVEAYMADPTTTLYVFGDGFGLDLAGAVRSRGWATQIVTDINASELVKRVAVRTAILL